MAKLYFRYGAMGSAKTLNLLAVAHNYRQQGKSTVLLKPKLDERFGTENIRSRAGLEQTADILVTAETDLTQCHWEGVDCVLVDEVQFFSEKHIEQLRDLTLDQGIPVICYGLRTDFQTRLFPGAKRLMELADSIEEVKATCHFCHRKSIANLRHVDGKAVSEGPQVQLGADEQYYPVCYKCYRTQIREAQASEKVCEMV